ncbi:unnamed protein product [Blepharisma stoltei]|uniref:C2H2-type domain-containing protein n=1 Tax=Blepharisma stoltei TaxID=1481888 RepID=A0AAU9JXS9_9CILI|nr:unnamed protein product [Blepharisma stoltei]
MKDMAFNCPIEGCNRAYKNKFNLDRHMEALHMQDKKYQCPHCQKILSSKQNLNEHLFTHSGEKPYVCKEPGCGMKFRQGSQLSAHKRIHVAIKCYASRMEENLTGRYYLKLSHCLRLYPALLEHRQAIPDVKTEFQEVFLPLISGPSGLVQLPSDILYSNPLKD